MVSFESHNSKRLYTGSIEKWSFYLTVAVDFRNVDSLIFEKHIYSAIVDFIPVTLCMVG